MQYVLLWSRQAMRLFWTEAEMILAADLADDRDWKGPNSTTPEVIELSALLNAAKIHPLEGRPHGFRSPGSVNMKVNNLIGWHPNAPNRPLRTSASEQPIVKRFIEDRAEMKKQAAVIRARILQGEL